MKNWRAAQAELPTINVLQSTFWMNNKNKHELQTIEDFNSRWVQLHRKAGNTWGTLKPDGTDLMSTQDSLESTFLTYKNTAARMYVHWCRSSSAWAALQLFMLMGEQLRLSCLLTNMFPHQPDHWRAAQAELPTINVLESTFGWTWKSQSHACSNTCRTNAYRQQLRLSW